MEAQCLTTPTCTVFYHGTGVGARAESILRDGVLRAATPAELDARYGKCFQRPVDGRVYLTSSSQYAAVYAVGGYRFGHEMTMKGDAADPDGYIFEVDGSGLDMVPDEDSLGRIPSLLRVFDWAPSADREDHAFNHFCLLYPEFRARMEREVARCLTPHVAKKAAEGMAVWQSKAGKALLRHLSPEAIARITPLFPHRSAPGPIRWTAAWKLPKSLAKLVTPDCSNLFQVATRVA